MRRAVVLSLFALVEGSLLVVSPGGAHHGPDRTTPAATARQAPVPIAAIQSQPRAVSRSLPSPRPPLATKRPRARKALSAYARMMRAVDRIPGYRAGEARWTISAYYGHWGATDMRRHRVYISPDVPARRLYDVVAHEWGHILTAQAYDGDVDAAVVALNRYYGGSGWLGAERAADCMARLLDARWTNYTRCTDERWRAGARRLLAGQRLP
jgi:hypothetical protein